MNEKQPSLEQWRKLYELISEIREIAPWEWLEESDLFAVENPETGDLGFVSIMGAIGEHYSIAVYLGSEGLQKFWEFQESIPDRFAFQKVLEMPQLQASFEDRDYLFQEDRDIIKKLSLTFRGKQAWPMFRSFRPGFAPWFLNAAEARFLSHVLEQTINVSQRAAEDPSILMPEDDDITYLLRKSVKQGDGLRWIDATWSESFEETELIEPQIDMIAFEKLKHMVQQNITLEVDLFMMPGAIKEKGERPYYPYALIVLENVNGMIVGHELLSPEPDLDSMWMKIPSHLVKVLIRRSLLPAQLLVNSKLLYHFLLPFEEHANISVNLVPYLPNAEQARESFLDFSGGEI